MPSPALKPAIFLMGPTAAGKTALALALRERFPVEVISVDSSQVYRGMDVGTAKPTAEERIRAPHRLINIRDPAEPYSAAEFCTDALREMAKITQAGRIPLLVGGTMFYFYALEYGITPLPAANPEVRARLSAQSARVGWAALHRRLETADPAAAARIHPHDAQRIQRALEIVELTGRAPSDCYGRSTAVPICYEPVKISIYPQDRAELHRRIARRFHTMLDRGLVAEVSRLRQRGDLTLELPSMRTVGYRQVWQYLMGSVSYNEMVQQGVAATRQLAKRQLTWLRRYPDVQYLGSGGKDPKAACVGYVASRLNRNGL